MKVKQAEAQAESMYLSGVGVARQRRAIMDGLRFVANLTFVTVLTDSSFCITETVLLTFPLKLLELLLKMSWICLC